LTEAATGDVTEITVELPREAHRGRLEAC
jgi:hypothetical protein